MPNDLDQWTAAVVKTHNYGRDYAALEKLLPLGLPYVALLGPRLRRDQLLHTLLETGLRSSLATFLPRRTRPRRGIARADRARHRRGNPERLRGRERAIVARLEAADSPARRGRRHAGVKIGAVILAAGSSSRLGRPKQLLLHEGQTLVRRTTRAALAAGCEPVVVVLGSEREKIATELVELAIEIVRNEQWQRGMGSSIRAGVKAASGCDAVVLLACDQPYVSAALLQRLIATYEKTQTPIVASAYAQTRGVPALFARSFFPALLSLGDEQGAKAIIAAAPATEVAVIDFPEGAIDIDTPQDYDLSAARRRIG